MRPAVEPSNEALALALDPAWRLRNARPEVPHLPYIPAGWNGALVLGEAQSLSKGTRTDGYVARILELHDYPEALAKRLWLNDDRATWSPRVHVAPWHSGPIRIGLVARWPDIPTDTYAVSNAVPWSSVDEQDRNENPDTDTRLLARAFLARIVEIYGVREIVACGRVAQWVSAGIAPVVCFPSGSARALASVVAESRADGAAPRRAIESLPDEVRVRADGHRIDDDLAAAYAAAAVAAPRLPGPATIARISVDPKVLHGRERIRGTRIPLSVILDNLAAGLTPDEIVASYPSLTLDDISAVLVHAADLVRDQRERP